jgi:hypothetical protein
MYRVTIALMCLIAALATGCTSGQPDAQDQNPARWPLYVPPGWHVLRFSYTQGGVRSTGIQLSNVRLPPPTVLPQKGTTVEISGEVLPPRGIGVVITPDRNHVMTQEKAEVPPLPMPWPDASHQFGWLLGSSPGSAAPVFEWLKFRANGTTYVAAVTIGWKASRRAQQALAAIVRSIRRRAASS